MSHRGKYWQPPAVSYEAGLAYELVPDRYQMCRGGFRSLVCWRVGDHKLRTDVKVLEVVMPTGEVEAQVICCTAEYLTQSGWSQLVVRPPETISGVCKPADKDFEGWLQELEKSLIQDSMRLLEG